MFCFTFLQGNKISFWNAKPITGIYLFEKVISPESGIMMFDIKFSKVDFPQPDGPKKVTISFDWIEKLIFSKTLFSYL